MNIKNHQAITHTYKSHNEDRCGVSEYGAWVIDGALPLSHAHHTDAYSDVVWMVTWWNQYLKDHLDDKTRTLRSIMRSGVDEINQAFGRFYDPRQLSKLDCASASIAIVRVNGDRLENMVLGDVEINIGCQNGQVLTLVDETMSTMDDQVINMIFNNPNRQKQIAFNGYTNAELKVLQDNRMTMNAPGGYTVLEHDPRAIENAIYKEYPLTDLKSVLIMSDGYSAVYNKYNLMSQKDLMETCINEGLEGPLNRIRQAEREDLDFKVFKRLRQHDDATALVFQVIS